MIANAEREQFKIYNVKEKQKDDLELFENYKTHT